MGQTEKVTIYCYGGCGRSVTLQKSKVQKADYYICGSRESGAQCEARLPPLSPGKVRYAVINAAGSFWGYTDEWPDTETAASVMRAQEIRAAGLAQMDIEKDKSCN
ncbi:hypothetical protein Mesil_3648 (plasmid) [Allomeiothermus silvanus DSM 9946]|uniref:Uncharacterized protein n=1 Tax=Allomeiothermus silvanus (strain ATCC 700542 / DSM 9946 / NBRC 106475 / NCIMB 13440 / VI-R2) TaxID=526227 RepID=D7BJS9_ALLS1|nr:hypothetical protein [Allomeiothermus silvanus]ADH65435.1 hypothetical protein Mesil_3648 [Allomeiothermus silvanus DSM 9946]